MNFLKSQSFDDTRPLLSASPGYFLFQYPTVVPQKTNHSSLPFFYSNFHDAYEVEQRIPDWMLETGELIDPELFEHSVRLMQKFALPMLFHNQYNGLNVETELPKLKHKFKKLELKIQKKEHQCPDLEERFKVLEQDLQNYDLKFRKLKWEINKMEKKPNEEGQKSSKLNQKIRQLEIIFEKLEYRFWDLDKSFDESLPKFKGWGVSDEELYQLKRRKDYIHFLIEMTEDYINRAFFERAFEYLHKGELESFLEFHYLKYTHDLSNWLDYVAQLITNVELYTWWTPPTIDILQITRLSNDWINNKRKILNELSGVKEIVDSIESREEIVKIHSVKKLNFNTTKGNKTALYYVLRQLYDKQILKNSWDEIAEFLIENVSGFEGQILKNLSRELSRESDPMSHRKIDIPKLSPLDE